MLYLTDNPNAAADFLPAGQTYEGMPADRLGVADARLWHKLGGGPNVYRCACDAFSAAPYGDRRVVIIDRSADSQFNQLVRALKEPDGLPDGCVAIALEGDRFRGQHDRPWAALRGNLHLTAHYALGLDVGRAENGLTMLPAVAGVEAIRTATQGRANPSIKWVNDLLVDGRKVAGVLTSTLIQGRQVQRAVFGLGINVARAPDLPPSPLATRPGALDAHSIALPAMLLNVVGALDRAVQELLAAGTAETLFQRYRAYAGFIGRRVRLVADPSRAGTSDGQYVEGRVIALNPDLSLVLEGASEPVRRGRLVLLDD